MEALLVTAYHEKDGRGSKHVQEVNVLALELDHCKRETLDSVELCERVS